MEFDLPSWFLALVGIPVFIAVIVDFLKRVGIIKAEDVGLKVASWLNFAFYIALLLVQQFLPDFDIGRLDVLLKLVGDLGVFILALVPVATKVSSMSHDALRDTDLAYSVTK